MKTKLQQAIDSINFDENNKLGGEYGLHDGFFNAVTVIDGVDYYFQCYADNNDVNFDDCGHDWGICGDVNEALAVELAKDFGGCMQKGYQSVLQVLKAAYSN